MMHFLQIKAPSLPRYVRVFAADVSPPRLSECLAWQIEGVIKSSGRRVCDLLSQRKLAAATAELEVRVCTIVA